jgi:hypothetical protein
MRNVVFFLFAACAPVADVNAPSNDPANSPFEDACAGADAAAIREARTRVENIQIAEGVLADLRAAFVECASETTPYPRRQDLGFRLSALLQALDVIAVEVPEVTPASLGLDTFSADATASGALGSIGVVNRALTVVDALQAEATVDWQDAMADATPGCALTASPLTEARDVDAPAWRATLANVNDGLGILDEVTRATGEVDVMLDRMRRVAFEAASDTISSRRRDRTVAQHTRLAREVDFVALTTMYQLIGLADGMNSTIGVQVGFRDPSRSIMTLSLSDLRSSTLGVDSAGMWLGTPAEARAALTQVDVAIDRVRVASGRAEAERMALTAEAAHIRAMLGE